MSHRPYSIEELLDSLCEHFDDELERQQNVLAVCRAMGQGARAQDHEYLEAKTAALHVLLRQAMSAEQVRLALVQEIVNHYGLPEERQTLSGLIAVVPAPWQSRMQEFQLLMRATLETTRRLVRENNRVLRRSLQVVNQTLAAMALCEPGSASAYNDAGGDAIRSQPMPALVDQRG